MAPGVPVAEGTTYTNEDVGYLFAASFVAFGTIRVLLEKLVIPLLWPPFNKLEPNVQKDFCVRCVSVVHSVISTYNSYWVLIDADLRANPLKNVSDQHFYTGCIIGGYFVYDTMMVLGDLQAEAEAAGACQTIMHHVFVLLTLPVGLFTHTWAWTGTGVLTFWSEVTGPGLNLIWILRTTVGDTHILYAINGILFSVMFTFIRVFVMGWYTYISATIVYENWEDDNPLGVRACKHVIPDWSFAGHGACQMGLWLNVGVWVISLLWVPAVYNKLYRGVIKFLAGEEAPDAGSKKQAKPRTKKAD